MFLLRQYEFLFGINIVQFSFSSIMRKYKVGGWRKSPIKMLCNLKIDSDPMGLVWLKKDKFELLFIYR